LANLFVVSQDGSRLVSWNGTALTLWNLATDTEQETLILDNYGIGNIGEVAISPDNRWVVASFYSETTTDNSQLLLWNLETETVQVEALTTRLVPDSQFTFTPNSSLFAFGGLDGIVHIWEPASAVEVATFNSPEGIGPYLLFSPDGRLLAVMSDQSISLWGVSNKN
jgi:WD40 repeat protein